ncbi:MAG: hypothetical protein H7338_05610 [Candidatus Sericytochromatia bacterium]|nr:hypothetical protein [Candidatus Sericytochromatia bacterium]
MIQPHAVPIAPMLWRQRGPWLIATLVTAAVLAGAPWVWNWATTATSAKAMAKVERLQKLTDVPVYPGASPDPFLPPNGRGPVQTAIYLTMDTLDQVKAFYRSELSLPEDLIRELPDTWVTDLAKANGDRLTIQAETQPEGQGTRLAMIYVRATP